MSSPGSSRYRRQFGLVLLTAAAAAALMLLASSQQWLSIRVRRPAPFAEITAAISGRSVYPAVFGFAVVALITVVLTAISGGWGRRVLGVLLIVIGAWGAWYGARGLSAPSSARMVELLGNRGVGSGGATTARIHAVWPMLTILSGAALVLAALALEVFGRHWSGGLPRRYDAPSAAATAPDPWRQMDRGEDPTISDR